MNIFGRKLKQDKKEVENNLRNFRLRKIENIYGWFLQELKDLESQNNSRVNEEIKKMETEKIQSILE